MSILTVLLNLFFWQVSVLAHPHQTHMVAPNWSVSLSVQRSSLHRSPCPMGHGIDAEAEFLDSTFSNEMMTFPRDEKWWKYDQSSSINYTKELILRHFFFLLHISRWPCFFRFVLFLLRCFPAENYSNISISIFTLVNSRSHYQKSPQLLIQILKPS